MTKRVVAVMVVALVVVGCSGEPTRDDAAALLSKLPRFTNPVTINVMVVSRRCELSDAVEVRYSNVIEFVTYKHPETGRASNPAYWITQIKGDEVSDDIESGQIPELCRSDYERATKNIFGKIAVETLYQWWIWETYIEPDAVATGIPAQGGTVIVGQNRIHQITGLSTNADGTMTVEYETVFDKTSAGEKIVLADSTPQKQKATLRKFDDGWRIDD